jgi:DNA polymerase III delta prime subunit
MVNKIEIYQGLGEEDLERLTSGIGKAYESASKNQPANDSRDEEDSLLDDLDILRSDNVPVFPELLGIDPGVYRQINAAIQGGKQHIMFYGPPGTGKTSLAQHCARSLATKHTLITGSSDWSSQDVIGGYQPIGSGEIGFVPGILLRHFDRPLVIDELNRCDIDKVIGPLFTVLSGQKTTLPFRVDIADRDSEYFEIFPKPNPTADNKTQFAPGAAWRLLATINSIDKASLYQMSYALTRRFAWIYIDAPTNLDSFLFEFFDKEKILCGPNDGFALAEIWREVNQIRVVGPAPILDMIRIMRSIDINFNFSSRPNKQSASVYLDAFDMFLLPMLDGIFKEAAERIIQRLIQILDLQDSVDLIARVEQRLNSVSI